MKRKQPQHDTMYYPTAHINLRPILPSLPPFVHGSWGATLPAIPRLEQIPIDPWDPLDSSHQPQLTLSSATRQLSDDDAGWSLDGTDPPLQPMTGPTEALTAISIPELYQLISVASDIQEVGEDFGLAVQKPSLVQADVERLLRDLHPHALKSGGIGGTNLVNFQTLQELPIKKCGLYGFGQVIHSADNSGRVQVRMGPVPNQCTG